MTDQLVLGIESSCDETAVAVIRNGREVLSSVVSSQVDLHARFGGVVPEIAGRAHLERIVAVFDEALEDAGIAKDPGASISAVAATVGPGLIGALLVGVSFAKSLAMAWGVPFVGVNHLEGHLYAALLETEQPRLPAVVLLVSGGHTLLIGLDEPGQYEIIGQTVDDAAGEAFDKAARFLNLGYPGGPAIETAAVTGDPHAVSLPRPMLNEGLDFSFSGLKTAVIHHLRRFPETKTADLAAGFQQAAIDVLVSKSLRAAEEYGAKAIWLAGGVAANTELRSQLRDAAEQVGLDVFVPSRSMCTDNAAMIAAAGAFRLGASGPSPLEIGPIAGLRLGG